MNNISHKQIEAQAIKTVSFHDLIDFKEDMLTLMKEIKSEVHKKLNLELLNFNTLFEKTQNKINSLETAYLSKIYFLEEREKIFSKIQKIEEEIEKNLAKQNIDNDKINKDLFNACYKYDAFIIDNLQIPPLIGPQCQFPNLKEYILTYKETLDSCIAFNKQKEIDFKMFKTKIDNIIAKFNIQSKMTLEHNSQLIKMKMEGLEKKMDENFTEIRDNIKTLSSNINVNWNKINDNEIKTQEKFEILIQFQKDMEEKDKNINDLYLNNDSMKNDIKTVKRNIAEALSLISKSNNSKNNMEKNFNDIINSLNKKINYNFSRAKKGNYSKDIKKKLSKLFSTESCFDKVGNKNFLTKKTVNINAVNRTNKRFNTIKNKEKIDEVIKNPNDKKKDLVLNNISSNMNIKSRQPRKSVAISLSGKANLLGDINVDDLLQKKADLGNNSNQSMSRSKSSSLSKTQSQNKSKSKSNTSNENKDNKNDKNNSKLKSDIKNNNNNEDNSDNARLTIDNNEEIKRQKTMPYSFKNKRNSKINDFDGNKMNDKKDNFEGGPDYKNKNSLYNTFDNNKIKNNDLINVRNSYNKDLENKTLKNINSRLNIKKNIFNEAMSKNLESKLLFNNQKYKFITKKSSVSDNPFLLNTLSSRKDDSQNKNIRYYNIFTSNGSNAKMIDNQKKLKISGSAVLGLPKMRNDSNQTYRNSLSYNRNEKENNKDIYLDKEIINNLKCVKDQDLIDKPLILYTKNYFRIDPTKSKIENKLIELEYFTKKKFDELVEEIKNFIPIHFNSHLRNYVTVRRIYE